MKEYLGDCGDKLEELQADFGSALSGKNQRLRTLALRKNSKLQVWQGV